MPHTITLQKSAFAAIIESLVKPNPEDPDGIGPWGPVMGRLFDSVRWRELNPQPIPRVDAYRLAEPHPIPWKAAQVARDLVARARGQYELAAVVAGAEPASASTAMIGTQLMAYVEELCPRIPFPRPRRGGEPGPLDLLAAAAELQVAAGNGGALQREFQAAADHLFEAALARMEAPQEQAA